MAAAIPSFISRVSQRNRFYPSSVQLLKLQQQNSSFIILIILQETLKLYLTFNHINQSAFYIASKLLIVSMNPAFLPWYAFLLLYFSLFFMLGMKLKNYMNYIFRKYCKQIVNWWLVGRQSCREKYLFHSLEKSRVKQIYFHVAYCIIYNL